VLMREGNVARKGRLREGFRMPARRE